MNGSHQCNEKNAVGSATRSSETGETQSLHPAWRAFLQYCHQLRHGEIQVLKIQDGLPVLAEVVSKKVKFAT